MSLLIGKLRPAAPVRLGAARTLHLLLAAAVALAGKTDKIERMATLAATTPKALRRAGA